MAALERPKRLGFFGAGDPTARFPKHLRKQAEYGKDRLKSQLDNG